VSVSTSACSLAAAGIRVTVRALELGRSITFSANGNPIEGITACDPSGRTAIANGNGASFVHSPTGSINRPFGKVTRSGAWLSSAPGVCAVLCAFPCGTNSKNGNNLNQPCTDISSDRYRSIQNQHTGPSTRPGHRALLPLRVHLSCQRSPATSRLPPGYLLVVRQTLDSPTTTALRSARLP
jgi:hypothetical protein